MSIPPKSRRGATGPRTPIGKKRSSRNSRKHGIFAKDNLDFDRHEDFCMTGCLNFNAQNHLEEEVCFQIAYNFVQRRAIEQFATRQQEQAAVDRFRERHETLRQENAKGFPSLQENDGGQLPSSSRRYFLRDLKDTILKRGCLAVEDRDHINFIYGDQPSLLAKVLEWGIALTEGEDPDAATKEVHKGTKVQWFVDLIEDEIELLEMCEEFEPKITEKFSSLPPDEIMEKLSRYRSSNSRELSRLVANFEALRKLSNLK